MAEVRGKKKKVTNLYVCEQFGNRIQLSKIKTRNVMARRKMNITSEYDRSDFCLILFFFHFFILTPLNYSKCRAHIHTPSLAGKRYFLRFCMHTSSEQGLPAKVL
jgi:hypothetical protein